MASDTTGELAGKIARLVQEKGWNGEDFARIAHLNRHTVRLILQGKPGRRLRNATISQCAEALGFSVYELRTLPLDRLLARLHGRPVNDHEALQHLRATASLPEFLRWMERHPDRVAAILPEEVPEILELQQPGGAMERLGVEHCLSGIERRRELLRRVRILGKSEYLPFLEQFVQLLYEKLPSESTK